MVLVGRAANAAERYADAVDLGEKALLLADGFLRSSDRLRGSIDGLLADAYGGQGLFDAAQQHYESALDAYRAAAAEDSPEAGALLASMAGALARQERWREAREAGIEAVEILDQTDSTRLPEALSALAELNTRRGQFAEAEGLRLSICHLWERLAGSESSALAREYERRADLLRSMQRVTEAGYLLGKAERIRRAVADA
jgi:tetratricopeptide (TPR) repeat protein